MNEALMRANLEACLATEAELAATDWEEGYADEWPVERAYHM